MSHRPTRGQAFRAVLLNRWRAFAAAFEPLETRQMLAAHIVGDPTNYDTIQDAVWAAAPGATINVNAGVYNEFVKVTKPLTIRGAQSGIDARDNRRLFGNAANESVMNGWLTATNVRTPSFLITANDVTIDGFTIQNNTQGGDNQAGLIIGPKQHGTHVLNNLIQNNVAGIRLSNDSDTDPAIIRGNVFRNNNNAGADGGRAIYSNGAISGGLLTNVLIDNNAFYNNRGGSGTTTYEGAIAFESRTANSQRNFTITNNVFDTNGKAVLAFNASNITIKYNTVTNTLDHWSGTWRFEGGVNGCVIQYNNTYNNTGTGVRVDSKGFGATSSGFVVTNNNFYGNSNFYSNKESLVVGGSGVYVGTLDARNNWWGDASGPSYIQKGTGDRITANGNTVLYSPWATAPAVNRDTAYWGVAFNDGGLIQAEDFDHGGEGIGYHDLDNANSGTKYRTTGVDIEAATDTGGGFDLGYTKAGEWLDYVINVGRTSTYQLDLRVANAQTTGGKFHIEIDGVNVTGSMQMPNTGGAQKWLTISKSGIAIAAGQHVMRLVMETNGNSGTVGNFNWFKLTNTNPAPAAPSNLLASGWTTSQINLTWTNNADFAITTGVVIERSLDGVNFTPIATLGANATSYSDANLSAGTKYFYRVHATSATGDSLNSTTASASTIALNAAPVFLSDLTWSSLMSTWGTAQNDQTVKGEQITLNGVTYARGVGSHADSWIKYDLLGRYTNFTSDIGVDDEVGSNGSVTFQVWGDGVLLFDSGELTGSSPTMHINVKIAGVQQLMLTMNSGADNAYDHADWADAKLFFAAPASVVPSAPVNLRASQLAAKQIGLSWFNTTNDQTSVLVERSTDGVNFAPIATLGASASSYVDSAALMTGTIYSYRVSAINSAGTSGASNIATQLLSAVDTSVYVSDIDWLSATSGWGTVQKDATIKGQTITLRGATYSKGLGTHADSDIVYNLSGQYITFTSDIGIDDETLGRGNVIFQVIGDNGRVLFDSGAISGTSDVMHVSVDVAGVQQLTLRVLGVSDNIDYAHADWAEAKLTPTPDV